MEGLNRVAKAPFFAHLLEQARGHAAAKNAGEYLQTVELVITDRQSLQRHRDVYLLQIARLDSRPASKMRRLGLRRSRTSKTGETPLRFGNDRAGFDRASRRDHHARTAAVAVQLR